MALFGKQNKASQATPEELAERKRQLIENQVENYVGAGGVSTKWLEHGLWYQEHRKTFILVLIWSLVLTAAIFWAYCLYYFTAYLFYGIQQDQENAQVLSQYNVQIYRPDKVADIAYTFVKALPLGDGRYDFVGSVTNRTLTGWVSFDYRFLNGDSVIMSGKGFIYPGETRNIVALGQAYSGSPYDVRFLVDNLTLHLFTLRTMPDWEGYKASHQDFLVQDKLFTPGDQTGLSEKVPVNRLTFNVTNKTAYSFRQAPFLIILSDGSNIVAVDRYIINGFKPKQRVDVAISFFGPLAPDLVVAVVPDMNILDDSIYGPLN